MNPKERYLLAKKITLVGALINGLLGVVKLIGGIMFHSHALAADGVHSFADLFTDIMVLFASKYGSQDADSSHPYGHQRIETAATLLLALLLILAGTGIAWDSLSEILYKSHDMPGFWALPIVVLSIIANEISFQLTNIIGKRIKSDLIIANAWHHRSDAASSVVVLIGLVGSLAGFIYLDAIAAVVVGLMIIHMGCSYGWNSVKELVDSAASPELLAQVEQIIKKIHGVHKIHQLRSRSMGSDVYLDVHIQVSPFISVSEGHFIAQHVHHALVEQIDTVQDVTVHVDPEDDETANPSVNLPTRPSIEKELLLNWQHDYKDIESWALHYLDGKLTIDLNCINPIANLSALKERILSDLSHHKKINNVRIFIQQVDLTLVK